MTKYFNALHRITVKRMQEKARIKKEFSDSGDADKMIDKINKKRKDHISHKDLPW